MSIHTHLASIQQALKAPKSKYNKFGKYHYRNCEDILEAVKPLLGEASLTLSDRVYSIEGFLFVEATATLSLGEELTTVTAHAGHPNDKKGMDFSQITGAASSYARKYALNGLFCIDDTQDADATNDHGKAAKPASKPAKKPQHDKAVDLCRKVCDKYGKEEGMSIIDSIKKSYKKIGDIPDDKIGKVVEELERAVSTDDEEFNATRED